MIIISDFVQSTLCVFFYVKKKYHLNFGIPRAI